MFKVKKKSKKFKYRVWIFWADQEYENKETS
jgi:hypothetical protein